MTTDPHWLQQFYKSWSNGDLEARLSNLMFASNGETEKKQIQAELERREKADELQGN